MHDFRYGRAYEKIIRLCDEEIFETLSKHNEYWDSEKLEEVRLKLNHIRDQLLEIHELLWDDEVI